MKAPHSLHMGPAPVAAPAATATKFWNVASVSEDEGEITLYGDVMSQQPIDWWTGEPEPGLYITPEGFMEDLAAVKLEDYNQVLIGVSVDTFMHEDMHTVLSSYLPQAGETAGN